MVNKRRQNKSRLPKVVDIEECIPEDQRGPQWRNPQLRNLRRLDGGWLSKLHGIRCEECSAVNRKMAKFCDQCGTELEEKNNDVDASTSENSESGS